MENIKDRPAQALDRTAFLSAKVKIYIGYSVDCLLCGALDGMCRGRIAEIRFVVNRDHGDMPCANLINDLFGNFYMLPAMRIGAVYYLYEKVCLCHFLECRFKRLDEGGGKFVNKADRIGQKEFLCRRRGRAD